MAAEASPKDGKRCHHCAGPLSKGMETSGWNSPPLIRNSFSMGLSLSFYGFYGFNHVMPVVCRWVKGPPMWLHFLIDAPTVIAFSSACAGLMGIGGVWIVLGYEISSRVREGPPI